MQDAVARGRSGAWSVWSEELFVYQNDVALKTRRRVVGWVPVPAEVRERSDSKDFE